MKKAGVLLIALGIFSVFLAFNMDVVIGTSYNIGLLNERQNIVYLSGVLFLAGIMLFGFGVVAKEITENLKIFTLLTFLIPIVLVVIIKIVSGIQSERANQIALQVEHAEQAAAERANQIALQVEQADQAALEARHAEQVAQEKRENLKILQENTDKFVDNKNGTITFKVTGLTWMRCSVGQIWTGETCSGEAMEMTWDVAMKLSNSYAGYDAWRLPTKEELMTLMFCSDGKYKTDGSCTNYKSISQPTINSVFFPNTPSNLYWSSSPSAYDSSYAWLVHFGYGGTGSSLKNYNYFVRLVR